MINMLLLICGLSSLTPGCDQRSDSVSCRSEPQQDSDAFSPVSKPAPPPTGPRGHSISISVAPCSDNQRSNVSPDETPDVFTLDPSPPPATQTSKTRTARASHTSPLPSRKLLQLFPIIALARSKCQDSQLANRIEEPASHKWVFILFILQSCLYDRYLPVEQADSHVTWVFSGFLPLSKTCRLGLGDSKFTVGVNMRVKEWLSLYVGPAMPWWPGVARLSPNVSWDWLQLPLQPLKDNKFR